jgi:inhibitor of KinA sporulation pathway (predicted exonuclease)
MYLFVDLEATCNDEPRISREEMEIIEIGAVVLDARLREVDRFTTFVRPVLHPVLTPFCVQLTTIQQLQVDRAPGFAEALGRFEAWFKTYSLELWSSWGMYDVRQFARDCSRHGLRNPLDELRHVNAKDEFTRATGKRAGGLGAALRELNLKFEGTPHRGVDDASNIGRIAALLYGDGA